MSNVAKGWLVTVGIITIAMLAAFAVVASANEPKFHFRDHVRINNGFYSGCEGDVDTVLSYNEDVHCSDEGKRVITQTFKYDINGTCKGRGFSDMIPEDSLTLIIK